MNGGTVIVGAGQAGAQLAISLREQGYNSRITIVGDESHVPYHRPPLSKDYMAGGIRATELPIRSPEYYQEHSIRLVTGTTATSINRESKQVTLSSNEILDYEQLVLATGARNRKLEFDGIEPPNVHYLRSRDDADGLRAAIKNARNILIIGAGFIGLEFASVASTEFGAQVTVVEMADRVMGRAVSEEISTYFEARHTASGTVVLCSTAIDGYERNSAGRISGARIGAQKLDVDMVVVGIGVIPNSELAQEAGLPVDNGILVGSSLATDDPSIFAIGDCARHPRPENLDMVRVESVQNAVDQARFLARQICGVGEEYAAVPWFWSHQAGEKLQIAGLSQPTDRSILLGDAASGRFSICRIRNGSLVAVESINSAGDHLASRKLLSSGKTVSEEELRMPGYSLRSIKSPLVAAGQPARQTSQN